MGRRLLGLGIDIQSIERSYENAFPGGLGEKNRRGSHKPWTRRSRGYERTRERRALASGLSLAPGTMLCALRLPFGTIERFWFGTAIDFRRLGDGFFGIVC